MMFEKEVLEELLEGDVGESYEGLTFKEIEYEYTSRWNSFHRMIFEYDGKLWAVHFSRGLTEQQWKRPFDDHDAKAYEVEAYDVVTVAYRPVR